MPEKAIINFKPLWSAIVAEAKKRDLDDFKPTYSGKPAARFVQLYCREIDDSAVHYEWLLRADGQLDIALHVEYPSRSASLGLLKPLTGKQDQICQGVKYAYECGPYGEKSAQAMFIVPFTYLPGGEVAVALEAATLMEILVHRTWPPIRPSLQR